MFFLFSRNIFRLRELGLFGERGRGLRDLLDQFHPVDPILFQAGDVFRRECLRAAQLREEPIVFCCFFSALDTFRSRLLAGHLLLLAQHQLLRAYPFLVQVGQGGAERQPDEEIRVEGGVFVEADIQVGS